MHRRSSNGPISTGATNQVTPVVGRFATIADFSPGARTSEPALPAADGSKPGPVNQALASSLTLPEDICRAALKSGRIELLSANGSDVTADFGNGVLAQINATRKLLGIADRLAGTRLCPE